MEYLRRIVLLFFFLAGLANFTFAQSESLRVYIDCRCDMNYIRQELSYVDHVRDQALADVQLFISDIRNGSGGRTFSLSFTGRRNFEAIKKELSYETTPTMTNDEVRKGLVKKIALGLVPYLMETDLADQIEITVADGPSRNKSTFQSQDPWNNWIFEIYGKGELERESSRSNFDIEFGLEADRVTEDWRIRGDVEFNHGEQRFTSDEEEFLSIRKRHYARGSIVKSLGNHWSAGVFSGISHDTYRNLDLSYYFQPAIEYNLFPYREVLRREITFAYRIGVRNNNYLEQTIYGHWQETLLSHSFDIQIRFRQPWGDIYTNVEASSYLHDLSKNSVSLFNYANVRIFKGLALRFSADLRLVRDQLNLPAGDASIEDILLRQRQIATDFEMGFGIGLSYTFGSAFNNIVNTRL